MSADRLGNLTLGKESDAGTYTLKSWKLGAGTATIGVKVTAATANLLASLTEELFAVCASAPTTYLHYEPGITYPVIYRVSAATAVQDDASTYPSLSQWLTITLTLDGGGRGAFHVLQNAAALNTPGSVDIIDLLGSIHPEQDTLIDDASGNDMHSVWVWITRRCLTNDQTIALADRAHWLIHAGGTMLTWSTVNNGTGAKFWGNQSHYTTAAATETATAPTQRYPFGSYKILALAQQASGIGYVGVLSGGATYEAEVIGANPHLVEICDIDLPVADTSGPTVAANITFTCRSNGSARLDVIGFVLIGPLDDNSFARYHPALPSVECDNLQFGPSGLAVDGIWDSTHFVGETLMPEPDSWHRLLASPTYPDGNTWPTQYGRTHTSDVTADTSRFKVVSSASTRHFWYAEHAAGYYDCPMIEGGEEYEIVITREVTVHTAGTIDVFADWIGNNGEAIRTDPLSSLSGTGAVASTDLKLYARAPRTAARLIVRAGHTSGTGTSYWTALWIRRCPQIMAVVAETSDGTLSSYLFPVTVTTSVTEEYEVGR